MTLKPEIFDGRHMLVIKSTLLPIGSGGTSFPRIMDAWRSMDVVCRNISAEKCALLCLADWMSEESELRTGMISITDPGK
jgi:hypothetical protein